MSRRRVDFIASVLAGATSESAIDDFVSAWHDHPDGTELHDYLGMTRDEYAMWLRSPDTLPRILERRRASMAPVKVRA